MVTFSLRAAAALAATAAVVAVYLGIGPTGALRGAVPFSTVLDDLRSAKTLQLRVSKEGRSAEVWVRAPGLVRWEDSPRQYRIAAGSRLWKIDEAANTIAASDSPWFLNAQQQVDLLGLLDVGVKDATALLDARPKERSTYDGRECFVYRVDLPARDGFVAIEAFADVRDNQLVGIAAWPEGAPRNAGPPLAELQLVAVDAAVDDSKFVVAKSLTEDGRIGDVRDAQGVVVLRPMLAQRWTPIGRETLLKTGDWLRTDPRGANAVLVRLSTDVELTLGPGTLVECISPSQARLHSGEVQVGLPKRDGAGFELLAPREGSQRFASPKADDADKPALVKQLWRVDRSEKLVEVRTPPQWLAGFEGTSNKESLGSLIVQLPDGRNEPLSVGYHKVQVEIRDQIARTTIEESFVNHTAGRLEGVFHFPLPQDASISGFGMWIGNDLVEADVVEKQRAREIYETILREKRDPGLLEWAGGNLFKARVFPIEAYSEKRIKIVYTQVLPLRANRYRYTYGLRSELLQARPLRELSLSVTVNSALPLKNVTCPTHTVRTQRTEHSAQVDFAAQEHTPSRDFEVVCEIDGRNSDVVVVPHRRGNDGYFLLQLTPPGVVGNWQREVLPEGKPLQLVLLCDTSASMDVEKRKQQAEFVATVLASLGAQDRFLLAAADVGSAWASPEPLAPTAENVAKAREFLEGRISLGWTDLERALTDVVKKAPADAHVVYIGDGIVSAGKTDPASFVKCVQRLIGPPEKSGEKSASDTRVRSFHAVAVGNTYEVTVLRGIAAAGQGSVRTIGGEQTPATVARELLNEIAQPGLRNLHVEFRGLKVAAVYPEQLPNVPAGTQQILVGRYLASGGDQHGEVIVTGTRGSEKVRYAAKVALKGAEEGNSFIPRLWARSHLDQLLRQGTSDAVRDEIIAMSEEFHIITPYTSLLVLETDADRERFGVKRRYEMRDGERFFAEGKSNSNYELRQQQMKRAGDWRLGLRRQVLRELATLGRDPQDVQRRVQALDQMRRLDKGMEWGFRPQVGPVGSAGPRAYLSLSDSSGSMANGSSDSFSFFVGFARGGGGGDGDQDFKQHWDTEEYDASDFGSLLLSANAIDGDDGLSLGMPFNSDRIYEDDTARKSLVDDGLRDVNRRTVYFDQSADEWQAGFTLSLPRGFRADLRPVDICYTICKPVYESNESYGRHQPDTTSWLTSLFPPLPRAPGKVVTPKEPHPWPADAIALSKSLLRGESLQKQAGGVEIRRAAESFDPRWNRRTDHHSDLVLVSPSAWIARPLDVGGHTLVNYCDANERGVFSLAWLLGRTRKPAEGNAELKSPPLSLSDYSQDALHDAFRTHHARVEGAGENQVRLIVSIKGSTTEQQFLIDTGRHVLLRQEWFDKEKLTATIVYDDFIEAGGSWWAKHTMSTDAKGHKTGETTLDVKPLAPPQFAERIAEELAAKPLVQFLHLPCPALKVARQRVADGSAGFDDRVAMILHYASLQQWDEMLAQLGAAEKLAADRIGVRWIRTAALAAIRRNEEARQRLLGEARTLVAGAQQNGPLKARQDELFLAEFILSHVQPVTSPAEYLEVIQLLQPVYDRQPAESSAKAMWQDRLLNVYEQLDRGEDALALRRVLAEQAPWDVYKQTDFAQRLLQSGHPDAAYEWLRRALDRKSLQDPSGGAPFEWTESEDETLRTTYAELYRKQALWEDLLRFTTDWVGRNPAYQSAYLQHLSALIYNDHLPAASALVEKWLAEARIDGQLQPAQRARLDAAISFAQGNCYNLSFQRMDRRWFEPLATTARFFTRHQHHFDIAQRILGHRFSESDACDRLRGHFLTLLRTELDQLAPEQIGTLVSWTMSGRIELAEPLAGRTQMNAAEVPDEIWKQIAAQLRQRWEKLPSAPIAKADPASVHAAAAQRAESQLSEAQSNELEVKHSLGESLRTIYANRFDATEHLPFLRARIASAPGQYKSSYLAGLFEVLLTRAWTDDLETEAFQLLRQLSTGQDPTENRLAVQLPALYRLVDRMIANRYARADKELHDQGKVDQLTRTELLKKQAEQTKAARAGVAARLAAEADTSKNSKDKDAANNNPLTPWLRIEQAYLDVQLEQNLPQVEQQCWQILGEAPPAADPAAADPIADGAQAAEAAADVDLARHLVAMQKRSFDALLGQRAFATAMNLAARRNASPESVNRALKYIDAGIARGGETAAMWRATKFQLLIALDRPDDLEQQLRSWIRADAAISPWRKALALLLAERGKLEEAIPLFEAAEKDHLLEAGDYRTLADWYLVCGRRQDYERTRVESFKQMPEHQLSRMVGGIRSRWMQTDRPLPSELDESTLFAFRALFEKSSQPENYLSQLRDLYAACRDFRLLQMLPDAVLGRSPQQIYAFLRSLQSQVLVEVRNEATADSILARIGKLREGKLTPTDLRALDLLEAIVERRSSEVLNQPQPHVAACLAAMTRAFDRQWSTGEPRLMAGFLHGLNTLHHPKLVDEQLRELRALQELVPPGSRDRLHVANDLCNVLFWSYDQKAVAIGEMEAAVRKYEQAHKGRWPNADNEILGSYIHLLEGAQHYSAGEAILQQHLDRAENAQQRTWMQGRMGALYNEALEHDGAVSLGKGDALFQNLMARGLRQLDAAPDENVHYNLVSQLVNTLGIAQRRKLPSTTELVRKFALEMIPAILKRQQQQYNNTAAAPRSVILDVLGPRVALAYLVERMEQYPVRLAITGNSAWDVFGQEMAQRRHESVEAKLDISELAPRVFKLTVEELKRELRAGENRSHNIAYIGHAYFWSEKAADFAQAANEVYAEKKSDGRRAVTVAKYLWDGLHQFPRAIEILLLAQRDGVLDESGREQLVRYLHEQKRFAESIPIVEPLVKGSPDNIHYRALLMGAYFNSQRQEQLLQFVQETDAHFHQEGRWVEGNVSRLGYACQDCNLPEKAIGYLNEAIALNQRAVSGRRVNDAGLSTLYQRLAQAHSSLGHTKAAVDAASGAIVCWGPRHDGRQEALTTLKRVLADAKDLPDFVHQLDAEAAKTGQDSAILRKAIGKVYESRNEHPAAIVQLQLAAQLQPDDKSVQEALIACYDASGDKPAATRQLLQLIEADRFNLALYQQLAERLKDNEAEAERAATSIIEAAPHEAENHAALAELRQKQDRWDEAASQWEEVAQLRRLEPTGLTRLAEAQLHLKRWDAARQSIDKLQRTEWPARFGDTNERIQRLREKLPK